MLRLYQTPSYEMWWHPDEGNFSLRTPGRSIKAVPGVEFLVRGKLRHLSGAGLGSGRISQETQLDAHGHGQNINIHYLATAGLAISLRLCLYQTRPFVLLRVSATNVGSETLHIRRFYVRSVQDGINFTAVPRGFFSNGWHSLSPAGYLDRDATPQLSDFTDQYGQVPSFTQNREYHFGRKGSHISEMVGAVITQNEALIGGGVTTHNQFVELLANLSPSYEFFELQSHMDDTPLDVGASVSSEWLYLEWVPLPNNDPFVQFVSALKRQMNLEKPRIVPLGWRTQESKLPTQTETFIFENVANAALIGAELPVKRIEIDIGMQTESQGWGYRDEQRFQHDYHWIAERIKGSGFEPELSLSPLIVKSRSVMAQEHPDWFVQNYKNNPLVLHLLEGSYHCLDVTNPAVYSYLSNMFEEIVSSWEYEGVHLKYMYAGSIAGKRFNHRLTRAQALHRAYECIRNAIGPEIRMTASQSAYGPAVGMVDVMQISSAASSLWEMSKKTARTRRLINQELPGVRNTLHNTMNRSWMNNRLWINDSGPISSNLDKTSLTRNEYISLISLLGMCGSAISIIDDLTDVESIDKSLLPTLFPPLVDGLDAVSLFDSPFPDMASISVARSWGRWRIVALINWSDEYIERDLPSSLHLDMHNDYHLVNFWERNYFRITNDSAWPVLHLDPHSVALLCLRPVTDSPQIVSTTFHISQGAEITYFKAEKCSLRLEIHLQRTAIGSVWLSLPSKPVHIQLNETHMDSSAVRTVASGIYEVSFVVNNVAYLKVAWCEDSETPGIE